MPIRPSTGRLLRLSILSMRGMWISTMAMSAAALSLSAAPTMSDVFEEDSELVIW